MSIVLYTDYTKPPFVDVKLPPAIIIPSYALILLYTFVLSIDFLLLSNEHGLAISPRQVRIAITILHILIPMIFISDHPPSNVLFAATPWFVASYAAHMPINKMTFSEFIKSLFKIISVPDTNSMNNTQIRLKGLAKVSLGLLKMAVMHLMIDPLLPHRAEFALEYTWLHPLSLLYTLLYGIKAYCLLGAIDIFMGLEQTLFGWNMIPLFNSPILSSSPRDFWSRRWNRAIRNLLHKQVFMNDSYLLKTTPPDSSITVTKDKSIDYLKTPLVVVVLQQRIMSFFTRTRQGRGLLAFIISGIFHELIIMSTCRRMTFENLLFFILQGLFVLLEVEYSSFLPLLKGKMRILCILVQLLQMAITGRLFLGPFLRYDFLKSIDY